VILNAHPSANPAQNLPAEKRPVASVKRHDVGIYAPFSGGLYDRSHGRAGGAERQMVLLAHALAAPGTRVAHIVYPVDAPVPLPDGLTLVYRRGHSGKHGWLGRLIEVGRIWRSLEEARPRVLIVRTGTPVVGLAALYCRLRRARLVFSGANNSDFTLERLTDRRSRRALYTLGVRLADAVVVQSSDQLALAERAFPNLKRVVHIPSFAENAVVQPPRPRAVPDGFLWVGRVAEYKRPLRYLDLARALPESHFRMIPVPDEPSAYQRLEEVRAAAQDIANLELLPPVPHAETLALIDRAVAVVNTSRLEGMPNVFLEAWARGVPVLSLEFDPDEVIADRGLGNMADGSWERFVEGARSLWATREDRSAYAQRTVAYVREVHSIEAVGAAWQRLISSL
jgi:glycosyltransferase involved in cell wall biosynthesis